VGENGEAARWEARSRGYALLARLVLRGPGAVAPQLAASGIDGFAADPDQAAADHHRWLAREILPWESVYLTPDRLLGGPRIEPLVRLADALPLMPAEPDHLGRELEIAGLLCGALSDAHRDRERSEVSRVSGRLTAFLTSHLAAWVGFPAIAAASVPGWGDALALAADLVREHDVTPVLPPHEREPLAASDGLRDVADWLATPLATGVAWTHAALGAVGERAGLPIGFGTRTDQLESLLRNAVDHGRVAAAAHALDSEVARWESAWGASPWAERTQAARSVLSRLAAAPPPRATG
jgi:hypothetical protein